MVSSCYFNKGDFAPSQQDALALEIVSMGRREAALLVVCDGIGGLQEGEYASSYVSMRVRDWFYGSYLKHIKRCHGWRRIERDCTGMLYDCNRYLMGYGKERGIRLGTTVTMVLLSGRHPFWCCPFLDSVKYLLFHAGDSRGYLVGGRGGRRCRRLTTDDSLGNHVLRRCIGSFSWQGVEKRRGFLRHGEKLLLCSDGFWRHLEKEEMAVSFGRKRGAWSSGSMSEEQLERRLVKLGDMGRKRGEKDNQAAVIAGG
ncbi:MAG: hypothetical protein HFI10_10015 [Lachnospiraceae bacterium]|jgi:serine/threonine protein phosphatase PrpC|nr:hypothetical protein [Lachnospiraceae bacterium]